MCDLSIQFPGVGWRIRVPYGIRSLTSVDDANRFWAGEEGDSGGYLTLDALMLVDKLMHF